MRITRKEMHQSHMHTEEYEPITNDQRDGKDL